MANYTIVHGTVFNHPNWEIRINVFSLIMD
jgi:hypothetical protein